MSINYSTPHRVDIPVTDLDDDDDDMLFHEQMGRHVGNEVDDLDFGANEPTMWNKISKYFQKSSYKPLENIEMSDASRFNITDTDDDNENTEIGELDNDMFKLSLNDNKFKTLIRKPLFAYIIVGISLLLAAITFTIKISGNGNNGISSYNAIKPLLSNSTHNFYPTTIVISLDGFHPHYVSPKFTPTLHDMMMNDYGAPYMIPSFPSSTFPNHWTLITGLYPSEHGIVGNTFYDPKLKKQFVNTNPKEGGLDPDFWKGGEPVWKTAKRQGVNSAVHMWPGSEVPGIGIGGGPLEVDRYNGLELLSSKVKKVMNWLDRSDIEKRPELILTYVPTIDLYGHKFGISGDELTGALAYVDDFVSLMKQEINSRNLNNIVNLIIVSDHGMAPTSNNRLLYLDDIIDLKKVEHIDGWPLFGLRPYKNKDKKKEQSATIDEIYKELNENLSKLDSKIKENFKIYKIEDLPKQWNFGGNLNDHKFNYRLAPIWIIPNVGYSITTHKQMDENNNDYSPKGVHGYNNTELLMRALFLGTGPYFKSLLINDNDDKEVDGSNKKVKPFNNTEVYNIICNSLNLIPSPNNGSFENGYILPIINQKNLLPKDWTDPLIYPNLDYKVNHIVNDDSTYDLLWKPKNPKSGLKTIYFSTNSDPGKSINSEESTFSTFDPSLPKPSDFSKATTKATTTAKTSPKTSSNPKHHGILGDLLDDIDDIIDDVVDGAGEAIDGVMNGVDEVLDNIFDHDDKDSL